MTRQGGPTPFVRDTMSRKRNGKFYNKEVFSKMWVKTVTSFVNYRISGVYVFGGAQV